MYIFKDSGIANKLVAAVIGLTIIVFSAVGFVLVQNQKSGFDGLLTQATEVVDDFAVQRDIASGEAEQLRARRLLQLLARISPEPIMSLSCQV